MAAALVSQVVGPLKQNARFGDWWEGAQPIAVPFVDGRPLPVTYTEVPDESVAAAGWVKAADAALTRFLALNSDVRHEATPLIVANYREMLDLSDLEPLAVTEPADIWRFIYPTALFISQDSVPDGSERRAGDMYVEVNCECEWELEHGLLLVFREGRMLTRVSDQDGHLTESYAYGRPDETDPLMMKYYATFGRPNNP